MSVFCMFPQGTHISNAPPENKSKLWVASSPKAIHKVRLDDFLDIKQEYQESTILVTEMDYRIFEFSQDPILRKYLAASNRWESVFPGSSDEPGVALVYGTSLSSSNSKSISRIATALTTEGYSDSSSCDSRGNVTFFILDSNTGASSSNVSTSQAQISFFVREPKYGSTTSNMEGDGKLSKLQILNSKGVTNNLSKSVSQMILHALLDCRSIVEAETDTISELTSVAVKSLSGLNNVDIETDGTQSVVSIRFSKGKTEEKINTTSNVSAVKILSTSSESEDTVNTASRMYAVKFKTSIGKAPSRNNTAGIFDKVILKALKSSEEEVTFTATTLNSLDILSMNGKDTESLVDEFVKMLVLQVLSAQSSTMSQVSTIVNCHELLTHLLQGHSTPTSSGNSEILLLETQQQSGDVLLESAASSITNIWYPPIIDGNTIEIQQAFEIIESQELKQIEVK